MMIIDTVEELLKCIRKNFRHDSDFSIKIDVEDDSYSTHYYDDNGMLKESCGEVNFIINYGDNNKYTIYDSKFESESYVECYMRMCKEIKTLLMISYVTVNH